MIFDRKTPVFLVGASKGGVGKTTTSIHLAKGLAKFHGLKTLLIDLDTQDSCRNYLGKPASEFPAEGTYGLMHGKTISECIIEVEDNLFFSPGGEMMLEAGNEIAVELMGFDHTGLSLTKTINSIAETGFFDVIIVDSPPATTNVGNHAWQSADFLIVTVMPNDPPSIHSLIETERLKQVMEAHGRAPMMMVVQTMVNMATSIGKSAFYEIQTRYKASKQYLGHVPTDAKLKETSSGNGSIFDYAPSSKSAHYYRQMVSSLQTITFAYQKRYEQSQNKKGSS